MNAESYDVRRLGTYRAILGEGPVWDEGASRLRWVDIRGHQLLSTDPQTGRTESIGVDRQVNAIVPSRDGWVVTSGSEICEVDERGQLVRLAGLSDGSQRFNDARADALGRLWTGTATEGPEATSALYRIASTECTPVVSDIVMSNGLGWSPDNGTLYFVDSVARRLYAFDFNLTAGTVSNQRTLIQLPEGQLPDGLSVDLRGDIWLGVWEGNCVLHIAPDGSILGRIAIPTRRVTSCSFGGPRYETLFITTARAERGEHDDGVGGSLFATSVEVGGSPAQLYAASRS